MHEHFFIIGAQRSGTSYLYRVLDEHPEIQMARPLRPEPKFFLDDDLYALGLDEYERRYFDPEGAGRHGEKSTTYIESERAASRVAAAFSDAAILAVLRDPVDRAVSNYALTRDFGLEDRSVDEALGSEDRALTGDGGWYEVDGLRISTSPFAYRARGHYVDHLAAWAARFRRDRLRVMLFEELIGDPAAVASVYEFLGADPAYRPEALEQVVNPGPETEAPSPAVAAELKRLFAGSSARLAAEYGLDLSRWPSVHG